jgi:hypothetical protein
MAVTGVFIAYSISFIAPYSVDEDALTSGIWRVVFIVPAFFASAQFLLFAIVFKYETPKYYQVIHDMESYSAIMNRIFINPSIGNVITSER